MRWFVIAVLGLGLVLPMLATDSFAGPGKSGEKGNGVAGTQGNQGSGPNSDTRGNAGQPPAR